MRRVERVGGGDFPMGVGRVVGVERVGAVGRVAVVRRTAPERRHHATEQTVVAL